MTAYGDDQSLHFIRAGAFVCTAPPEAPCRTYPTCECENWCGCEPEGDCQSEVNDHCCMTTVAPGRECWMAPWIEAADLGEAYGDDAHYGRSADWFPDGPVTVEWDDGCYWTYADDTTPRDPEPVTPDPPAVMPCGQSCSGCESCQPDQYVDLLALVDQTRASP